MDVVKEWAGVVGAIVSIVVLVYGWLTSGSKENSQKLVDQQALIDGLDSRVQALESEMRHLPDKELVHRLELTMKDMQVQMAGMAASAEATARTARRVEEFLLDQAKTK
jgi:hypothetical protein